MLAILLQTLALASAGLLSFGSMTLVILLLISDRGWRNGLAYALGYISAYGVIGVSAVVLGVRAASRSEGEPGIYLPMLLMALGALLLWLSWRNGRKPASQSSQPPRFFAIVDSITPPKAFGFGALVTVINFKNLALFLSAQSVVILSDLPMAQKILVTVLAVLVFCLSVAIPVLIYLIYPRRARDLLNRIKATLEHHSRQLGIWAPLLFGLIFLLKGFSALP